MVFPGGLAVFPLLPAVAVASVANLLATVEQHGAAFWPEKERRVVRIVIREKNQKKEEK